MTTTPAIETASTVVANGATTHENLDINVLARQIARDGASTHSEALGRVADMAADASMLPGAVSVLRNPKAPESARARAFLAIARQWDKVLTHPGQRAAFERAFADLAAQWVAHQELRSRGDIAQLALSGSRLDELRSDARSQVLTNH